MGYAVIDPDEIEPLPDRPSEARPICGITSASHPTKYLGVRLYRAQPGEQLPLNYHYNEIQEEAFYVINGPLAVETPDELYSVPTGHVFIVEPGNPHRAHNPSDAPGPIDILAMGAPTDDRGIPYEPE